MAEVPGEGATFGVVSFRLPSSLLYDENVLACSCCYDKMPLSGKLTNNRNVFVEVLDSRENEVVVQAGVASGRTHRRPHKGRFLAVCLQVLPSQLHPFFKGFSNASIMWMRLPQEFLEKTNVVGWLYPMGTHFL